MPSHNLMSRPLPLLPPFPLPFLPPTTFLFYFFATWRILFFPVPPCSVRPGGDSHSFRVPFIPALVDSRCRKQFCNSLASHFRCFCCKSYEVGMCRCMRTHTGQTVDVPFFLSMCSDPTARVPIRRMPVIVTDRRSPIITTPTMSLAQTRSLHALDVIVTIIVDHLLAMIADRQ
jgi:hypothetical protein